MLENNFTNPTISIEQLPTILTLDAQSLSEQYAPLNRLINLGFILFVCVLGMVLYFQPFVGLPEGLLNSLPFFIWIAAVLGFLFTWLSYARDLVKSYSLRALDLHYKVAYFFGR